MSIGASAAFASQSLSGQQSALAQYDASLTSGKRITSAAVDPSGLAIYENLTAQATGLQQGGANVADALNAANTASGALESDTSSLQLLNGLAVRASNDLLSSSDRTILQNAATQFTQQLDTNAQNARFNGTNLLDGSIAGSQPAVPASATIASNAALSGGGTLVQSVGGAPATSGTISLSVVAGPSGPAVQVRTVDSSTGAVSVQPGLVGSGGIVDVGPLAIQLGTLSSNDVGTTATIETQAAAPAQNGFPAVVQTGANEGATQGLQIASAFAQQLGIESFALASTAGAQNAEGQFGDALSKLTTNEAALGAQSVALHDTATNDATAANAVTGAASTIGDTNVPDATTAAANTKVHEQITLGILAKTNANQGYLSGLVDRVA
jgi:flagellin